MAGAMFGHVGVSLFVASALMVVLGSSSTGVVPGAIFGHVGVSLFRGKGIVW